MKNKKIIIFTLLTLLIIAGCSTPEKQTGPDNGEFLTVAENELKKVYGIDNIKFDYSDESLKVFSAPDDENLETGETYTNLVTGLVNFSYQDKFYKMRLLYSKLPNNNYVTLHVSSTYNDDLSYDVKLKSEQE